MKNNLEYEKIKKELEAVLSSSDHLISNLSNFCAVIMTHFKFHWVGFYLKKETSEELFLGPFQGPLACTQIPVGKGVCGSSFKEKKTLNVPNVDLFDGHIACSSQTKSELVIPLYKNDIIYGVLDIDSTSLNRFSELDQNNFESFVNVLESKIKNS
jgi:L-methionine (R)-S-oxide reductase